MKNSNYRKFLLLWTGELVSAIGGGLTSFGLGVYVFTQTGSAGSMAIVTLLAFLPTLLLSVPAGVLADRVDRRLLMILGDGCSALGLVYILIRMYSGGATLIDICAGVFVSAVFSALLDPAYKATISDLLTEEEFSKAGGLVSLAGSARYLVSPMLAGLLLTVSDVKLLLIIDICTFFLTAGTTLVVRRGMRTKKAETQESFTESLRGGWSVIRSTRGVLPLIWISAALTLFLGVFQVLAEPMILSMADAKTLGVTETVCACGMLVSSLFLGIAGLKKGHARVLSVSMILAGGCIMAFGMLDSIPLITAAGFGFFLMLPFANNCLDYLLRTNIDKALQGRVWGFVGFLSQIGYVIAYGASGVLADGVAALRGVSVGQGAGTVIAFSGIALAAVAVAALFMKSLRALEKKSV